MREKWYDYKWSPLLGGPHSLIPSKDGTEKPLEVIRPKRFLLDHDADKIINSLAKEAADIFNIMLESPQHLFFLLCGCKFENVGVLKSRMAWPLKNVHLGARVSSREELLEKYSKLRETESKNKFVILKGLQEPLDLEAVKDLDYLIVERIRRGDPDKRNLHYYIRAFEQCTEYSISFYFGGYGK